MSFTEPERGWSLVFPHDTHVEGWAWTGVYLQIFLGVVETEALDTFVAEDDRYGGAVTVGEGTDEDLAFLDETTGARFALLCRPHEEDPAFTVLDLRLDGVVPAAFGLPVFEEVRDLAEALDLDVDLDELADQWVDSNARATAVAMQVGFTPIVAEDDVHARYVAWNALSRRRRNAIVEHFDYDVHVFALRAVLVDDEVRLAGMLAARTHQFVPKADYLFVYDGSDGPDRRMTFEAAAARMVVLQGEADPFSFAEDEDYDGEDFDDEDLWGFYVTPIETAWVTSELAHPTAEDEPFKFIGFDSVFSEEDVARAQAILEQSAEAPTESQSSLDAEE